MKFKPIKIKLPKVKSRGRVTIPPNKTMKSKKDYDRKLAKLALDKELNG